jgi:hypothetical protein
MQDDRSSNDDARRPFKLQFSLRSLLIATAVLAADLGIVGQAGPAVVLGLVGALTTLTLGIGGMILSEAISRADRSGDGRGRVGGFGRIVIGYCAIWLFILGGVGIIAMNLLAAFPWLL